MKRFSENHKEAAMPNILLSQRTTTWIGKWNVQTLYETRKTAQVAAEVQRYNLAVLRLCETKWAKSGLLRLSTRKTFIYSGNEEEGAQHTQAIGLMLSKQTVASKMEWAYVS
jgi:hypothetical protein